MLGAGRRCDTVGATWASLLQQYVIEPRESTATLDHLHSSPIPEGIGIYITIMHNKTMDYSSHKLPLLLERVGVRRIKSSSYIPLIPTFSLWRRSCRTCVDTYALKERQLNDVLLLSHSITELPKQSVVCYLI